MERVLAKFDLNCDFVWGDVGLLRLQLDVTDCDVDVIG